MNRQHSPIPTKGPLSDKEIRAIESRLGKTVDGTSFVKCSECGKMTHPDRVRLRNLLPVCRYCL